MSSEIRSREENGAMIFEKDKLNDLEIKFFNPEYFSNIGFPDAEIKIVNKSTGEEVYSPNSVQPSEPTDTEMPPQEPSGEIVNQTEEVAGEEPPPQEPSGEIVNQTEEVAGEEVAGKEAQPSEPVNTEMPPQEPSGDVVDHPEEAASEDAQPSEQGAEVRVNEMKGGYYADVESLTLPFRYFVYFVQPKYSKMKRTESVEKKGSVDESNTNESRGSLFHTFYDGIKNTFSGSNMSSSPVSSYPVNSSQNTTSNESSPSGDPDAQPPVEDVAQTPDSNILLMWVVKIPITTDESAEQMNEYKKEDLKLTQILREYKMEQSNHIIVKGEVFNIGNRSIKIAQTVEEGTPVLEVPQTKLPGTKMSKYEKM